MQDIIAEFRKGNLHLLPEDLINNAVNTLRKETIEKVIEPTYEIARKLAPYRDKIHYCIDVVITLDQRRESITLPLIGAILQDDAQLSQLRQILYANWDLIAMDPKLALFLEEERLKLGSLLKTMRIHLAAGVAVESLVRVIVKLLEIGDKSVHIRGSISVKALCQEIQDWRSEETILDTVGSYLPPDFDPAAFLFDVEQLLMGTTFPLEHLEPPRKDDEEDTLFTISI